MSDFGERLRQLRAHIGVNQEAMSKIMGVGYSTYQHYEQSISAPKVSQISSLSDYSVNFEWLITGKGKMLLQNPTLQPNNTRDSAVSQINEEVLVDAMAVVDRALAQTGRPIAPTAKAKIVAAVYDEMVVEAQPISEQRVVRYLRLVTG